MADAIVTPRRQTEAEQRSLWYNTSSKLDDASVVALQDLRVHFPNSNNNTIELDCYPSADDVKGGARSAAYLALSADDDVKGATSNSNNKVTASPWGAAYFDKTTQNALEQTSIYNNSNNNNNNNADSKATRQFFEQTVQPIELSFDDIILDVAGETKGAPKKRILHGISGRVRPGELCAVMGLSGSGKTSLITALGRPGSVQGVVSGAIRLNGAERNKSHKTLSAHILQDDVMFPALTVRETLAITAKLRLNMNEAQRNERVQAILDILGLQEAADTIIGSPFGRRGVSGGERRRCMIANELLTSPSLILADEPTSGIDASIAYGIVKAFRRLARAGRTVILSIHQPSSIVFGLFDKVLLLSGGRTVFYGAQSELVPYFSSLGYPLPPLFNPADFMLELVAPSPNIRLVDEFPAHVAGNSLAEKFCASFAAIETSVHADETRALLAEPSFAPVSKQSGGARNWPTSFCTQFSVLMRRAFTQRRNDAFTSLYTKQIVALTLIVGLLWFQKKEDKSSLASERISAMFFIVIFFVFSPVFAALTLFNMTDRPVVQKERANGSYRLGAYYCGKIAAEAPLELVFPSLFFLVIYWVVGFRADVPYFFANWGIFVLSVMVAQSFGLMFGTWLRDMKAAIIAGSVGTLGCMLGSGFYLPISQIPSWLRWVSALAFPRFAFNAVAYIEFTGRRFRCDEFIESEYRSCAAGATHVSGEEIMNEHDLNLIAFHWLVPIMLGYLVLFHTIAFIGLRRTTRSS
jgi:ABC-type multidrug transport system ATPase subunit/ABC-type multidrug transport system permease subunit